MSLLQGPSLKQAEMIRQEVGEGRGELERCLRDLQNMLAASPHLPQPENFETGLLELFVYGCRMDMERARAKLQAYCAARSRHRDLYEHRSLLDHPLKHVCDFIDIATLPKLTDEGLRVTIFRLKPGYPDSSCDIADMVRAILLISDTRMRDEKLLAGDVFVYDVTHVRGSFVGRVAAAFSAVRRGIQLAQAAYPQRLKRIHVVGAPPFLASTLQLIRNCVNEKVRRRYYLHAKVDELLEHIPARVLPAEWGGEEESIDYIVKKWKHRVEESRDYLRKLNEVCQANPTPLADVEIYGTIGAFRKLDID